MQTQRQTPFAEEHSRSTVDEMDIALKKGTKAQALSTESVSTGSIEGSHTESVVKRVTAFQPVMSMQDDVNPVRSARSAL